MSTITATGDANLSLLAIDFDNIWQQSHSVFHSNSAAVVGITGGDFVFGGSGFSTFDSHGYATAGTVTSWSFIVGDLRIDVSDFTVSASDLQKIFRHDDSIKFARVIYGDDDTITLNTGGGTANGYWGDDTLNGRGGDDHLFGYVGDDTLFGGDGVDRLQGDAGADLLKGGKGADSFEYELASDSKKSATDTIADLHDNDLIDLSDVDADSSTPGDDDDFVLAGTAFGGNAGELIVFFDAGHNRTVIQGDVDGDSKADLTIWATGNHADFDNFGF